MIQICRRWPKPFLEFQTGAWWGTFGPKNLPKPVIDKIRAELTKALTTPDMQKIYETNTLQPIEMTQEQFVKFLDKDQADWTVKFKQAGLL